MGPWHDPDLNLNVHLSLLELTSALITNCCMLWHVCGAFGATS